MPRFPYKKLPKYPHLRPRDVRIWEAFISTHPLFFDRVDYDIKVGKGIELPPEAEEPYSSDMKYLTKKRIDVVGYKDTDIYIIEVKPRAGLQALGQAKGLAELYRIEGPSDRAIYPCIITDIEMPDIRELSMKMGIKYLIV